ncbi:hypothetical protein B7G55_19570 [Aeromonas hydrophila]|uniref:SGNH/GDSL hydrolase family protein n=1 Tax=Aeromonas hydrophila TaxID=644 RepID=UPI000A1F2608|nr:SGNH/GDSL hydrolase family protein [Aeromonas hydrophila]OSP50006.1 hypothetical protein B7G55_19570 [Aeromonas hydrophila]
MYWPDRGSGVTDEPARRPVASVIRQYFTEGGIGVPPTVPGADWFNQITNELLNVLEAAGIEPSKTNDDQLLQAITQIAASSALSNIKIKLLSSLDAKTSVFSQGDMVFIVDYGYWYQYSSSREIIQGFSDSTMTYDDILHILVDSGGMLKFVDWSVVRKVQSDNKSRFSGKLKSTVAPISGDCYADSVGFGQAQPSSPNATNRIGQQTNFGDGSTYENWQFNEHYPKVLSDFLGKNLANSVSISNRGYSGDRAISAYLRHRAVTGTDFCTVGYGINDQQFASSNAIDPSGINSGEYSVLNYALALRLFVAKQILNGKHTVVLGTTPFGSLVGGNPGFDGTAFSAAKLSRAYNAAAKSVAAEFGCPYVDVCHDIFSQYAIPEICDDGTHLSEIGLKVMGTRLASSLLLVETTNVVSHGSVIVANPNINSVATKINGNVLPNSTSVTPRGDFSNEKTTMVGGSDWITIPFYADTDGLYLFVNGVVGGSSSTIEIRLDDGALQSDFHYQYSKLNGKPGSIRSRVAFGNFNRETENISLPDDLVIAVANRGWHSVSIRRTAGTGTLLFDSVYFESIPSVISSDLYGVTSKAVWTSGAFDSSASLDVSTFTNPSPGVFEVLFKNQRIDAKYQVVVDFESSNIANMYRVAKTPTGFTVSVLSGSGAGAGINFQPFTPPNATFSVIGGR